jgi:hypothetical protein
VDSVRFADGRRRFGLRPSARETDLSAQQFKDVALPVTDMYTAIRIAESCRGLPKVLKAAVALFLLDR